MVIFGYAARRLPCPSHIFRGVLLQHYSKSLNKPTQPNSLSSVSTYLIESLGFSNQQAISTEAKLIRSPKKVCYVNFPTIADSVITFFQQNGFDQSHIQKAVSSYPPILLARVDQTLKPKFEAFQKLGLSASHIAEILSFNPHILHANLDASIMPAIQALRTILGCDNNVFAVIKNAKRSTIENFAKYLAPNVALLQSYGIPIQSIPIFLMRKPRSFSLRTETLKDALIKTEHRWGICRHSKMFLYGVMFLAANSERSIELKCQVFKNFGWTDSEIMALVRRNPYVLCFTEERMKKQLNFLMKELGYEPAYLAAQPALFTYSLEKRIAPRHRILLLLKERGLVKEDYSLINALTPIETRFLEKFVRPFKDEIANLHEIYANSIGQPAVGREDSTCCKR